MTFGRYGCEFEVGQTFHHRPSKTVSESDNNLFCLLTMNHHPLHLDADFAASTAFGKQVVVGTLVLSLAVGISVPDLSGAATAALSYDDVIHLAPVHIGDTISASSDIIAVRQTSDNSSAVVIVTTWVHNQHGVTVLRFNRTFLVPWKPNSNG